MSATQLTAVLPGHSEEPVELSTGDLKARVMQDYLENPFRDEDVQTLAIRLGRSREEMVDAVSALCDERLLKPVAERGYALNPEGFSETAESTSNSVDLDPEAALIQFHEELFDRLREDLVKPLAHIQNYLESQEPSDLGPARAALEQINDVMTDFMLGTPPTGQPDSDQW